MFLKEVTEQVMEQELQAGQIAMVFVHTPFCATCQLAERMLYILEEAEQEECFYRLNASFFPDFMEQQQISSVPALLLLQEGVVVEQIYAFESVTNMFHVLERWRQKQSISF